MPDGLAEHRGDDAIGRPLQQLAGKAAADAVAHVKEFADAEMVHQPELVVGEGVPRVLDRDRTGRLAAIGVALVHRDAAEIVLEFFHRVDHRGRPIADPRVQAAAGGDQQWEAGAGLLVADADVAFLVKRHGSFSFPRVVICTRVLTGRMRVYGFKPKPAEFPQAFRSSGGLSRLPELRSLRSPEFPWPPCFTDAIAAIGVIVSLGFLREPTYRIRIWDEVGGGAPPLIADQI